MSFDWDDEDFEDRYCALKRCLERVGELLRDKKITEALEEIERELHPNFGCGGHYSQGQNGTYPFLRVGGDSGKI